MAMSVRVIAMVVGRGHADSSDETWSVSELISFLTLAITIFQFVFQHHTAWLLVSLGINVPKSEKQVRVSVFFCFDDDDCFYYHSWRNNVVIAFGTLSSFLT